MDVSKTPPLAPALAAAGSPVLPANVGTSLDPNVSRQLASLQDRVDIRSLDPAAALQILIAEVRGALVSALLDAPQVATPPPVVASAADVAGAPLTLVEFFLRALPAPIPDARRWSVAADAVEQTLQTALQRAMQTIAAWREVAPAVVETAKQVQSQALALIADDPVSPLWLSPEWLGVKPRMVSYWRRRRAARRRLLDPDFTQQQWEAELAPQGALAREEGDSP